MVVLDDERVSEWCRAALGSDPVALVFRARRLSIVLGLRLADGREVVVKARSPDPRLAGCYEVQNHLFGQGFPCPEPLVAPAPLDDMVVSAESYVGGGEQLQGPQRARHFAKLLARLVELAPAATTVDLLPNPPWAWPDAESLWPAPDGLAADLNAHPGPGWLDDLAAEARQRLLGCALPGVVGHADFESQNMRWVNSAVRVVHDWDSAATLPEPVLAGLAAAVFTATGAEATEASVDETAEFLGAYQDARGAQWPRERRALAWWAGLWVRSFNAKKAYVRGDMTSAERLLAERDDRLRHAES